MLIPVHPDQIDDEQIYHTITSDQENFVVQMKADLEAAKQQLELKDKEIASYQEEKEKSETVLKLKNEAMGQMEAALDQKNKALERKNEALDLKNEAIKEQLELRDYYRELADTYRKKADGGKWFSLSAGVGATSDHEPAALVGIGIKRFRVWAFAQESNTGVMGGFELPLF